MKLLFLILPLTVLINSAISQPEINDTWEKVSESTTVTTYINPITFVRVDNTVVKGWSLVDFKSPFNGIVGTFSSLAQLIEYNCNEEKIKITRSIFYYNNMGKGDIIFSSGTESPWQTVVPDSIIEVMWSVACDTTIKYEVQ